jgi:hypothetical protein
MTAYDVTTDGIVIPRAANGRRLAESHRDLTVAVLESRIADLESRLQEEGWQRLGDQNGREFSRDALDRIVELARIHYLKNPLVKRAVEVGALYVWGQDLTVNAADEGVQAVVDRFWSENRATLTGQQASRLLEVELEVTGNVFLALFPDRATGLVRVRTVPMEEVREIVCNTDDRYEPWFYRREWQQKNPDGTTETRKAIHPDWRHQPADQPADLGGIPIRWDAPVLHVRAGAFPHWRWGVSEVYAALDWAKAYKELLEDDATRSRALARFAWHVSTTGGAGAVAAAKTRLGTTLGTNGGETNPPPAAGSAFIADKSVGLDPIRIAGSTLDPDHSRPVRLMASAGLGIADHFYDADTANYATSKTLDRPTELRFSERRQLWKDVLTDLIQWVIDRDIEAARGLLRITPTADGRQVDLQWPSLLERETKDVVGAIVTAATLGSQSPAGTIATETLSRLLLVALGVEDVDDEVQKATDERSELDAERDERAAQMQRQMQGRPPTQNPPPSEDDATREAFVDALREVRAALAVQL